MVQNWVWKFKRVEKWPPPGSSGLKPISKERGSFVLLENSEAGPSTSKQKSKIAKIRLTPYPGFRKFFFLNTHSIIFVYTTLERTFYADYFERRKLVKNHKICLKNEPEKRLSWGLNRGLSVEKAHQKEHCQMYQKSCIVSFFSLWAWAKNSFWLRILFQIAVQ